jgi:GntR family transcriptional repressor for pyruvate dehydrogenase complex
VESKRKALIERLTAWIDEGRYRGGDRLPPERELAAELKVSRNLLREALITLECLGYLDLRGREGVFVRSGRLPDVAASLRPAALWPSLAMEQLMEVRSIIEVPTAALAARRRTDDEARRLRLCLGRLQAVHRDGEQWDGEGAHWDSLLHRTVVEAAHNDLLQRVHEGLAEVMERYIGQSRRWLFSRLEWPEIVLAQHEALVESVCAGDGERASQVVREHIERALAEHRRLGRLEEFPDKRT